MRLIGLAVILMLSLALFPFVAEAQQSGRAAEAYRIGPEDVLRISVWKNDALSGTAPVRPDGKISLPLLNDVQATGFTALELRGVLIERFREFIPSPEVSVIVLDMRRRKVVCLSAEETTRPGCYEVSSSATVLDVLALTGGLMRAPSRPDRLPFRRFFPQPSPAPYWWDRG